MVELAALLDALFVGIDPLSTPSSCAAARAARTAFLLLRDLQQLLERAALRRPLLIAMTTPNGPTTNDRRDSLAGNCASWECRSPG